MFKFTHYRIKKTLWGTYNVRLYNRFESGRGLGAPGGEYKTYEEARNGARLSIAEQCRQPNCTPFYCVVGAFTMVGILFCYFFCN